MVAQLRGAKFFFDGKRHWPKPGESECVADDALHDVAGWLGFKRDGYVAKLAYVEKMTIEGPEIFKRAKD